MTITAGTDTYTTLAEASTYFGTTFKSTEWALLSDATKEIALRMACQRMEQLNYIGVPTVEGQTLQFPRSYTNSIYDGTPQDVKSAQCELALYLYQNQNNQVLTAQQMGLKSISLGNESYSFGEGVNGVNYLPCDTAQGYVNKWISKYGVIC